MSGAPESSEARLEEALVQLTADIKAKSGPHRHHARAILIPLGQLMIASKESGGPTEPGGTWLERLQALSGPVEELWQAAVQEELSLACAEHIRAVDPRFLDHPGYDFAYTVGARSRLEARLLACQALDIEVSEGLLDRVGEADARLAPYLESKT